MLYVPLDDVNTFPYLSFALEANLADNHGYGQTTHIPGRRDRQKYPPTFSTPLGYTAAGDDPQQVIPFA